MKMPLIGNLESHVSEAFFIWGFIDTLGAPHGALFYIPVSYATAALPFPVLAMQPVLIGRHMDA